MWKLPWCYEFRMAFLGYPTSFFSLFACLDHRIMRNTPLEGKICRAIVKAVWVNEFHKPWLPLVTVVNGQKNGVGWPNDIMKNSSLSSPAVLRKKTPTRCFQQKISHASCPSCSISHAISKSSNSGGEPVLCDYVQHATWVVKPQSSRTTNNLLLNTISTANRHESRCRNPALKLYEKFAGQEDLTWTTKTDNGRSHRGWDHQIHTSRLPRMIRSHMYTR